MLKYKVIFFLFMQDIPLYIFIFLALYAQVFIFLTLFEEWDHIFEKATDENPKRYPKVVIAVPAWNEGKTVEKTLHSLLELDYPKDKLEIWAVDDGSKDNTFEIMKEFSSHPQIKVFTKENGGKHSVLNFVIEKSESEIFGCLDADSTVETSALKNIILKFEKDPDAMAVTPLMVVRHPKNLLQAIQSVEYNMGIIFRKIFSSMNAIHVTPGPFSLFRKEVFSKIGVYHHAHNTEDMEFAFRMQKNHLKIASATDAYVETNTPNTFYKLYKQRLRWSQGFMQNSIDYKDIILRPKYGNMALFTIPVAWIGIITLVYMTTFFVYHLFTMLTNKINEFRAIGLHFGKFDFSRFVENSFFSTDTISLLAFPLIISGIIFVVMGHYISKQQSKSLRNILYFIVVWQFIVPFWIIRALFNTLTKRSTAWR